jgi:hypothetical protein
MTVDFNIQHMGPSTSTREVATGRRTNFSGYFPSTKNGKLIVYESLLERDFIALLEDDRDILSYDEQPPTLIWSDGIDTYETTFDFRYEDIDHQWTLVEVKPLENVLKHNLIEHYAYARAYALRAGYHAFELWTDREIRAMPRLANADMKIFQDTPYWDDTHLIAVQYAMRKVGGRATIRELRAASNLKEAAYRVIVKLVAQGDFVPERPDCLLDDNAVLLWTGRST